MPPNPVDDALAQAMADATAEDTVVDSVVAFCDGVPAMIAAAVAAATPALTPQQAQAFTDLSAKIKAQGTKISDAIVRNTPAAPNP